MTELSREILRDWQVRKTKAQKQRFIDMLQRRLPGLTVEEGGWPHCRNLVLGNPDSADVLFTAHYDTCARLPFPNFVTPKNLPIYLLYQVLILIPFFVSAGLLAWGLIGLGVFAPLAVMLGWFTAFSLILYAFILGPANPHTVNDNTSGVLTLCELIAALSEEERARCAFVFFDHEETGLFGSAYFRSRHKKAVKSRLVINFDCVSDGDHILIVYNSRAKKRAGRALEEAFFSTGDKQVHLCGPLGGFYPSDQVNFPCSVGVAAMNKAPVIGLYMARIHTPRDTVCDERNFSFLVEGARRFLRLYEANND